MLAAAAQATSRMRLGTYVLNAAFYSPALLVRDAADVDLLSDGRLDLGLGAGYVREEFELAEIPFPTAGQRVRHLQHVTEFLKATELKAEFTNGSQLGQVIYPPGIDIMSEGVEEPISVYEGTIELKTTITVPENFSVPPAGDRSVPPRRRRPMCRTQCC